MPEGSSPKRERQYEHIKESYKERGRSTDKAEELAARTVNKQRAQAGETKSSRSRAGGSKSSGGSKTSGGPKSSSSRSKSSSSRSKKS